MLYPGLRITEKNLIRPMLPGSDREFRFLASQRVATNAPDSFMKSTNSLKNFTSQTGAASIWVAHLYNGAKLFLIATTYDPIKFMREPPWLFLIPQRLYISP